MGSPKYITCRHCCLTSSPKFPGNSSRTCLFPFAPTNVPNNANSLAACWPLLLALSAIHSENCMPCAGPHLHHLFRNQPVVTLSISVDTRNVRVKFVGLEGALLSSASVVWGCVMFPQKQTTRVTIEIVRRLKARLQLLQSVK